MRQAHARRFSSPRPLAVLGLIALFAALTATDGLAQVRIIDGVHVDIAVGFSGRFRHAAWSPVAVDVSHPVGFTGTLELAVPRTDLFSAARSYVRLVQPLSLQAGESRRFWFTVPLRGSPYPLSVTIRDRAGRIVGSSEKELRAGVVPGSLFLILDPSAVAWTFLPQNASNDAPPGASTEIILSQIRRPSDLPADPIALASASAILVRDTFPLDALSPEQVAAIATYVRSGGHLIVTGGSSPPAFPLGWLSWLPELSGRVGTLAIADTLLPAWELYPTVRNDTSDWMHGPLWSSRPVGAGRATIIAFDPSSPVLASGEGLSLREKAAQLVLESTARTRGPEISDDDIWALINQIEISYGNNQLLTAASILYVFAVTAVALLAWHRPAWYSLLVILIIAASWYAWDLTASTGIRDQVGFAHVQLTRGLSPGIVVNRSYTLAVSMAHGPRELVLTGPQPPVFPAPYRPDDDVVAALTPAGTRFERVLPTTPIRVYHDSIEEIDIHVRKGANDRLTIVNRSDYELRYVHYIERRRLANLGHIPPRTTRSWTEPSSRVASAGWMGMTLQTGLMRHDPSERPEDVDIRLLALAADRGLDESLVQAEAERPFIVALIEPIPLIEHVPGGQSVRKRVLILPVFDDSGGSGGGALVGI